MEVLIKKDDQAHKNIGDPSEFLGLYSIEEEEDKVAEYIERDEDNISDVFASFLDEQLRRSESPLEAFTPKDASGLPKEDKIRDPFSLYPNDFAYAAAAVDWLRENGVELQADIDRTEQRLALTAPADLRQRLKRLPAEARPEGDRFILTPDRKRIEEEIRRRRDEDSPWARRQYLWPLHPVMEWLSDRALGAFGRHTAPVFRLHPTLEHHQAVYLLQGGYPNRRGYPLIQAWLPLLLEHGKVTAEWTLEDMVRQLKLVPGSLPNRGIVGDTRPLAEHLEQVVSRGRKRLDEIRKEQEGEIDKALNSQMQAMEELRKRHKQQLELQLEASEQPEAIKTRRLQERGAHIDKVFDEYLAWLNDTQIIEDEPYLQVAAVFTGEEAKA